MRSLSSASRRGRDRENISTALRRSFGPRVDTSPSRSARVSVRVRLQHVLVAVASIATVACERNVGFLEIQDLRDDPLHKGGVSHLYSAGDLDRDGLDDLLVSQPNYDSERGRIFVLSSGSWDTLFELVGKKPGSQLGIAVGYPRDVDGDERLDYCMGSVDEVFVVSGRDGTAISSFGVRGSPAWSRGVAFRRAPERDETQILVLDKRDAGFGLTEYSMRAQSIGEVTLDVEGPGWAVLVTDSSIPDDVFVVMSGTDACDVSRMRGLEEVYRVRLPLPSSGVAAQVMLVDEDLDGDDYPEVLVSMMYGAVLLSGRLGDILLHLDVPAGAGALFITEESKPLPDLVVSGFTVEGYSIRRYDIASGTLVDSSTPICAMNLHFLPLRTATSFQQASIALVLDRCNEAYEETVEVAELALLPWQVASSN